MDEEKQGASELDVSNALKEEMRKWQKYMMETQYYLTKSAYFSEKTKLQDEEEPTETFGGRSMFDGLQSKLLRDLKNHIVQIECLVLGVILFSAILSIGNLLQSVIGKDIGFLFPFIFLAVIPLFVRVTNPSSMLRSMLTWGMSGAGIGGMVGGSITGTLTGGLGAPAGALIGAPLGFVCGIVAAPFIDRTPCVLTQGNAREFLIREQKQYPELHLQTIVDATEYPPFNDNCHVAMFLSDGTIKCTKKEVERWLESKCWKDINAAHGVQSTVEK